MTSACGLSNSVMQSMPCIRTVARRFENGGGTRVNIRKTKHVFETWRAGENAGYDGRGTRMSIRKTKHVFETCGGSGCEVARRVTIRKDKTSLHLHTTTIECDK